MKRVLLLVVVLLVATIDALPVAAQEVEVCLCRDVADRDPVDPGKEFPTDVDWLYCHVTLSNLGEPTQIHHDWYFQGTLIERITLSIGTSARWRTWSAKKMGPAWAGDWEVVVKTDSGRELARVAFTLKPAVPPTEPTPAP